MLAADHVARPFVRMPRVELEDVGYRLYGKRITPDDTGTISPASILGAPVRRERHLGGGVGAQVQFGRGCREMWAMPFEHDLPADEMRQDG